MTASDIERRDVAVILPAAGVGARMGPGDPKALRRLGDQSLLAYAVRRVAAARSVGYLVVAAPPYLTGTVRDLVAATLLTYGARQDSPATPPEFGVVPGGAHRQRSVAAALASVPADFEIVLVHDAARALAPTSLMEDVAAAVRDGHPAVTPVVPVADTMIRVDATGRYAGHLDRSALRAVQTPQGFRRGVLVEAHSAATDGDASDDTGLASRTGVEVHTVPGSDLAFKITTAEDLAYARALLDAGAA